jgi:hypothetical protein
VKKEEMREIVEAISYKPGWTIVFADPGKGKRPYVQLEVDEASDASLDAHKRDGIRTPWRSGKRYLSQYMCNQEIVGAVFGAIHDAEMHELREWFRFRGASIYNPHLNPEVLVPVARKASSFVTRVNAMSVEEPEGEE